MTISHEYAEELGRQIDELEAENERLRELSTCARLPAATVDAIKAAIREHFKSIGTSSVASSDGIERVYYNGFSLDKLADAVAAGLSAQPPTAASREDALEVQGTIEQLEKQLAFERKKSEPNFLHAGSPLWRIDLLCEQHELYTKDELVGLIQKVVQDDFCSRAQRIANDMG